jgi:L-ascorbate metabolism protein UlaG (beta-lactamase superfamily)
MISAGSWSRPGLQLAELITDQRVPNGRVALWRVGKGMIAVKSAQLLILLMPEFTDNSLLQPEDLPAADYILFDAVPPQEALRRLANRTSARFIGPARLREMLPALGMSEDRAISLSPGARVDLTGLTVLATPAHTPRSSADQMGFFLQIDHLSLYHVGFTEFLGEFSAIGGQFHPQVILLPLGCGMTMADGVHAAKQLQPRLTIPLGPAEAELEFARRCRDEHASFAAQTMGMGEGRLFDGWHLQPLS